MDHDLCLNTLQFHRFCSIEQKPIMSHRNLKRGTETCSIWRTLLLTTRILVYLAFLSGFREMETQTFELSQITPTNLTMLSFMCYCSKTVYNFKRKLLNDPWNFKVNVSFCPIAHIIQSQWCSQWCCPICHNTSKNSSRFQPFCRLTMKIQTRPLS